METIHRVGGALLVVALVSTGGSGPLAHVPLNQRVLRPRLVVGGGATCVVEPDRHGQAPGTNALVRNRYQQRSIAPTTGAVARAGLSVATTPALVELWEARIAPDLPGQPVPVATSTAPNPHLSVVLGARAPPV